MFQIIIQMFKRICIVDLVWMLCLLSTGDASVYLTVPSAGNCGEDTILTCNSDEALPPIIFYFDGGVSVRPEYFNKYSGAFDGNSFTLTLHNTDIKDQGQYVCASRNGRSDYKLLRIECRAEHVNLSVTKNRTLAIVLDKIYPQPKIKLVILDLKDNTKTVVSGTFTKKCSSSDWMLDCVWTSSNVIQDGNYSYIATITTITTSDYSGFFRINTPNSIDVSPSTNMYRMEENKTMNDVNCSADCAPACQYVWSGSHGNNVSDSNVLSLGQVDRTADGEYTCKAWNWFGQVTMSISLTTLYGPENMVFNPTDTTYTKPEGAVMGSIQCSVICNPSCLVNWFKAGLLFSSTGNLDLENIQRDDMGVYQCVATNNGIPGNPSIQQSIEMNVRYGPDTVRVSSGSDISLVTRKMAPNITCTADCNPFCSFTWTNMTSNSAEAHGHILHLGIADFAIQGEYRCTVTNNATGKTIYSTLAVSVESANLPKEGTPIGLVARSAAGTMVMICLIVTVTLLFYRRRKQNVKENIQEQRKRTSQCSQPPTETMEADYEEITDGGEHKKDCVFDQLDVPATGNGSIKERRGIESQSQSLKEPMGVAYEELKGGGDRSKDVYDQLDVTVTDESVSYENTPKPWWYYHST